MRNFEFDPEKSASNKRKHGIDFEEAQALWDDPRGVVIQAKNRQEPRSMLIAELDTRCWSAVFTMRGDTIRLISVRRSQRGEANEYRKED